MSPRTAYLRRCPERRGGAEMMLQTNREEVPQMNREEEVQTNQEEVQRTNREEVQRTNREEVQQTKPRGGAADEPRGGAPDEPRGGADEPEGEPHFISAYDIGLFTFFFLRENAVEHDCGKTVYSRVAARLQERHRWAASCLEDTWTTFHEGAPQLLHARARSPFY
ncbi:hypothetical protein CRUP_008615 [Coryphaenoides rupestris]|nr:hypothetical protein CRUP_008615 [Coryphaenoides rupestris]